MSVRIEEKITALVTPLAQSLHLVLWGLEIIGSAKPIVRIYVDTLGGASSDSLDGTGVNIDQCAELSRLLGLSLDVEDLFPKGWVLEISSPGMERRFFHLKQMRAYLGREIEIRLAAPLPAWSGRKNFCGQLAGVHDTSFTLDLPLIPVPQRKADEPDSVEIPWNLVQKATLVPVFPKTGQKKII